MTVAFLAISVWWLALDRRLPEGDNGKHLGITFSFADVLRNGDFTELFKAFTQYPPLTHTVSAIGLVLGPNTVMSAVMTENLVFVPLLALGCYKAAALAFDDRRVGALAVAFVLAAPIIMGQFHVMQPDGPQAALVAISVWALLATERFERQGLSIVAGIAVAFGFYAKSTFPLFVAGLILVMLLRGGWRNWRGFAFFCVTVLVIVQPWYFYHYNEILGLSKGAAQAQVALWYGSTPYPARWSLDNFTWYFWNGINNQLYLPLVLLTAVGVGFALVRWVRTRKPDGYLPELLAGGLVSYVAISLISLDDPRYTLPAFVYVALLGTFWMVRLSRVPRYIAVAALGLLLVVNTVMVDFGVGGATTVELPNYVGSPIRENSFTIFSSAGTIPGGSSPSRVGGVQRQMLNILTDAHKDGFEQVYFEPESLNNGGWNQAGLAVFASVAGMKIPGYTHEDAKRLTSKDLYVFRQLPSQVTGGKPCMISFDKTGIFMVRGLPAKGKLRRFYCPSN